MLDRLRRVENPALQFSNRWFAANRWQFEQHLQSREKRDFKILEIGCFEGQGTCWMLENIAMSQGSHITCVDICEQPRFWQNINVVADPSKVDLRLGCSRDILPSLPKDAFDFVFIDGSHAAIDVLEDAVFSFRLAKVGALIAFDDYKWKLDADRPQPAVDAFLKIYRSKIDILTKNYQVWLRKIGD